MFKTIIPNLEKIFIRIIVWILFFKKEKEYGSRKLKLSKFHFLAKGFYSAHPIHYDFKKNKYSDYISDIETIKLAYLNHPYGRLLRNKLIFSNYFNSYFKTPECFCVINKGKIEPVNAKRYINSFTGMIELAKQKKLILKPLLGTGGTGIILIENKNNTDFYLNKKQTSLEDIKRQIDSLDTCLVTEFIEQGKFSKQFFPNSANTIRITTLCDPDISSSFIPYSFMRFGRQKTIPADNISLGGMFSMIDIDTGELSEAIEIVKHGEINLHANHPDTNILIKGVTIPNWNFLKDFFIEIGSVIKPFIKIAGWDIILTDDSFVVIEGNNGPDLYMQGASYPFAKIPEVKKFLKQYHIR